MAQQLRPIKKDPYHQRRTEQNKGFLLKTVKTKEAEKFYDLLFESWPVIASLGYPVVGADLFLVLAVEMGMGLFRIGDLRL